MGTIELKADMPQESTEVTLDLPELSQLLGKHALYFKFASANKQKSICTLEDFAFQFQE